MFAEQYGEAVRRVFAEIDRTQRAGIETAAGWIADSLAAGGCVHMFDTGHMLNHEAVGRSGGLMAWTPLQVAVEVTHPARQRPHVFRTRTYQDQIEGLGEFVVLKSSMLTGDVLIVGSVSGYNALPVEICLRARAMGIKTVAITSVPYSRTMKAAHKSGLRLFEAVDLALDSGGVAGDAAVTVPGLAVPFGPTSGLAAAYINWLLQGSVVEALLARGLTPSVYLSNHMPGAAEHNARAKQNFAEKGY